MNLTETSVENLTLNITDEIRINASLETTFAALLEEIGPNNVRPDGTPMPMTIEAWPGGRWYRDLGGNDGHFWGHIQAIKRPELLEIVGPMFMSYPVASHVQYRLLPVDGGTLIKFQHSALGFIADDHRRGVTTGWKHIHARVRAKAESKTAAKS